MGSGAGTAVGATLDLMTGGTGVFTSMGKSYDAYKEGKKERKIANQQIAAEQKAIAEQKQAALEERKGQIDALRRSMGGTGRGTRGTNLSGVRAVVNEKLG